MKRYGQEVCWEPKRKRPKSSQGRTTAAAEDSDSSRGNSSTQSHVMASTFSTSSQKPISEDVLILFRAVKERLQDERGAYDEFLQVMRDYQSLRIDSSRVITKLKKLFRGHSDLILRLNKLLQKECEITPLEEKDLTEFQKALCYIKKVQKHLGHDNQKYKLFLRTIYMFETGEKSINGIYEEVAVLFQGNYDLLKDFTQFLPDNAKGAKFYNSHADGELSNSSSSGKEGKRKHIKKCKEDTNRRGQRMGSLWHVNNFMDNVQHKQNLSQRVGDSVNGHLDKVPPSCKGVDDPVNGQLDKEPLGNETLMIRPCAGERHRDKKPARHDREKEEVYETGTYKVLEGRNKDGTFASKHAGSHKDSSFTDQKQYSKPVSELDLSNCERCTPSYCLLPEEYIAPPASYRTELDASVLNDVLVSVTYGSEDHSFKHIHKNLYEENLFKCEDDRFELDMLLEMANGTTKRVEELLVKVQNNTIPQAVVRIEDHFTSLNLRCIEKVYGDHGLDAMDMLRSNTRAMLPVILTRLKQKQEEWSGCLSCFNDIWSEIYAKNYRK